MQLESSNLFNNFQKVMLAIFTLLLALFFLFFKNTIFRSNLLLKDFGNSSLDPEIAFLNKKPTYLEFYADWCEVCKKMAPAVEEIKKEYNNNINFVFLNVDNPKWAKYVNEFDVNGIPQINLFDKDSNLQVKMIGLQDKKTLRESINDLDSNL